MNTRSSDSRFIAIALLEGVLILIALFMGWWFQFHPWHDLTFQMDSAVLTRLTLTGLLATVPLFFFFVLIERMPWAPFRLVRNWVYRTLAPWLTPLSVWQLIVLGCVAGVSEELLFRGAIQFLATRWLVVPIAILVSATIFGLAHLVTWWYALLAGLAGLYLGWLFAYTGSIIPPIVAHAVYDVVALIYLARIPTNRS